MFDVHIYVFDVYLYVFDVHLFVFDVIFQAEEMPVSNRNPSLLSLHIL